MMKRRVLAIAVAQACRMIGEQYHNQYVQRMIREQQAK